MTSINTLRQTLFDTLQGIKDGSITLDKARAINEISKTLVDTAKVEVEYLRVTDEKASSFIQPGSGQDELTRKDSELPNGITGITRHVLAG